MAIHFRDVTHSPLHGINLSALDHSVVGVVGLKGAGKSTLLRLAAGLEAPAGGAVDGPKSRRLIGPGDPLNLSPVDLLCVDRAFCGHDALVRERSIIALDRLRRAGGTILAASHDEFFLSRLCDEVWWLDGGAVAAQGDARDVLGKYGASVAGQLVEWGKSLSQPLDLATRRGDARAEVVSIATTLGDGQPSPVLRNQAPAAIEVRVRFNAPVESPVIGVMIRSRVGLDVYGTNTELEGAPVGPRQAGDEVRVEFRFLCGLCPGEYTVTAASHDPDGTAHDWLDDAIEFAVASHRYTAGVADLRAEARVSP